MGKDFKDEVRRLREEGLTITAISKALDISRPTVYKILSENGEEKKGKDVEKKTRAYDGVIPVTNPSPKVKEMRESVELSELELRMRKSLKDIEKLEKEKKISQIIQEVKKKIFPVELKKLIPLNILTVAHDKVNNYLSKVDVLSIPIDELIIGALDVRNAVFRSLPENIKLEVYYRFFGLLKGILADLLKEECKEFYPSLVRQGFKGSFGDFLEIVGLN